MGIAMIVTSKAQPGKRGDIHQLWLDMLAPLAEANDGQQVVVWCNDQADADTFHLFEIYASPEAMGANAQSPAFAEYMQAAMPMLAGEPSVSMGEPAWSKGLA